MHKYRISAVILLLLWINGSLSAQSRPNVLFVAIDDLNDWVGFLQGHPNTLTPNLDRLAQRGMVFERARCQATICAPSRASLMTGLYPSTTGIYLQLNDQFLQQANEAAGKSIFLPDYFEQHGYQTLGVGKLFHNGDGARVFEEYGGVFEKFGPKPAQRVHYDPAWFDKPGGTQTDWGPFPTSNEQMPDWKSATWAIEHLRQSYDQPFFMAVGFVRPHVPWHVPQEWFDRFDTASVQLPPYLPGDLDDVPEISRRVHEVPMMPTTDWAIETGQWKEIVRAYLACITFVDAQLGRVLDALEESSHADNTLIVLWSDHGYHLGEKNRFAKHSLWERTTHVPLLLAGPGIDAGQRCPAEVGLIDLYPTLLDLCGLPANPQNEGRSLMPLLGDPQQAWPYPARTTYGPGNHSLHYQDYHYLRFANGAEELYRRDKDPHEWTNLALQRKYRKTLSRFREYLPREEAPLAPKSITTINDYFQPR